MRTFLLSSSALIFIVGGLVYMSFNTKGVVQPPEPVQAPAPVEEIINDEFAVFKNQPDCFDNLCGKDLFFLHDVEALEDPFDTSDVVASALRGDKTVYINSRGDWVRVLIRREMGWVKREDLADSLRGLDDSSLGFVSGSNLYRSKAPPEPVDPSAQVMRDGLRIFGTTKPVGEIEPNTAPVDQIDIPEYRDMTDDDPKPSRMINVQPYETDRPRPIHR